MELRALIADPAADGHGEILESLWLEGAGEFDPAAFDIDAVNESLASVSAVRWPGERSRGSGRCWHGRPGTREYR